MSSFWPVLNDDIIKERKEIQREQNNNTATSTTNNINNDNNNTSNTEDDNFSVLLFSLLDKNENSYNKTNILLYLC